MKFKKIIIWLIIAVVILSPTVFKITRNYIDRKVRKLDVEPILSYDPELQKEAEQGLEAED